MSEPMTGPWAVDDATYFSDTDHVSSSMLKVANRSLVEYHGRFITGTIAAPKPSAEMHLGTCLHAALLEPEKWIHRIISTKVDGRTKGGKEYNAAIEARRQANPASLFCDEQENATVIDMMNAVYGKPEARQALDAPGTYEGPIRWQDLTSGMRCKAKIDKVCDNGLILDIKTATDLAGFSWSAHKYGYERQAAHYLAGAWEALGLDGPFLLVVVQSVPPHEVRVMVFGEDELAAGRRQNVRLLAELAECHRSQEWKSRYKGVEVLRYRNWQLDE